MKKKIKLIPLCLLLLTSCASENRIINEFHKKYENYEIETYRIEKNKGTKDSYMLYLYDENYWYEFLVKIENGQYTFICTERGCLW